ncbi:ATP-binding protein [Desulfomonile tiedjei]|uniref:ATP-binding protein n=1 Tax=Desulfomonile tiedjei TaxID=2358 RepID=UPI00145D9C35|nr:AAA family ATPase [Desulfomonile tiedjei]
MPQHSQCPQCGKSIFQRPTAFGQVNPVGRQFFRLIAGRIFDQKGPTQSEKKLVTLLFADISGYEELSKMLAPEQVFALCEMCFAEMTNHVVFYGGTVGHLEGKGFCAVFGAPLAFEDHAQRACCAALAIQNPVGRKENPVAAQYGLSVEISLGLHSGLMLMEASAHDPVNELSDIESTCDIAYQARCLASPGKIVVSENTRRLAEGFFIFSDIGTECSAGSLQVPFYELAEQVPISNAFDARIQRGLTKFVNRNEELQFLQEAYETSTQGMLFCLSIVADAGVGKSRLLYEFRKRLENGNPRYLELKCQSQGKETPYYPFIPFVRQSFSISGNDESNVIRAKVTQGLAPTLDNDASVVPWILELLSVTESGIETVPVSPESRKYRIMDILKRLILWYSGSGPMVFALEDLHWIDAGSKEFLNYLMQVAHDSRIFMILTYRPEFIAYSNGLVCKQRIDLKPLLEKDSRKMTRILLNTDSIDPNLEDLIIDKTEGVPFFLEEFLTSAKDLKFIKKDRGSYKLAPDFSGVSLPLTVNSAIMARVDKLPRKAKKVLRAASAIEREFSYDLMQKVTRFSDNDLEHCFGALQDSNLIYGDTSGQECVYVFRHALTRDVVYDSISGSEKSNLHVKIGVAIEEVYASKPAEVYAVLTHHYFLGRQYEKAAEFAGKAGKKARRTASFAEAIAYTRKRVECLEKLTPDPHVQAQLIDSRTSLGIYLTQMNNHLEAKKVVDPILHVLESNGVDRKTAQMKIVIGTYYCFVEEDFSRGLKNLEEAIEISENNGDIVSAVSAYGWMGIALSAHGEFFRSLVFLEKALHTNQSLQVLWGVSMVKSLISSLVYNFTGELNLGIRACREAARIAEESGDKLSKGMAFGSLGMAYYYKGDLGAAKEMLSLAASSLERADYYYWEAWAHFFLGSVHSELETYDTAAHHHERSISIMKAVQIMPSCVKLNQLALELIKVRSGHTTVDVKELSRLFYENRFRALQGWMARIIAEILLEADTPKVQEAEMWIRTAIIADSATGMKLHHGRDYVVFGRICSRSNRLAEARDYFHKAAIIFGHCEATGDLKRLPTV